ncbi:Ribonuclease H-like domain containing protein [Elaphomyces granulatus]
MSTSTTSTIVPAETKIRIIDSTKALLYLLDNLTGLAVDPPSLYLDLEGVLLGRHGSLCLISLYVPPKKRIYLVDIYRLGKTAFSTANSSGSSLKAILESSTVPKVVFDIRNDSDALFSLYGISVDGIQDLQLMELATRKGSKNFVAGLAKCIEHDSRISAAAKVEWQHTKELATRLYSPQKGGRYEVFNERPIKPEIVQYCARDVVLLPALYNVYNATLSLPGERFWQVQVSRATKDRIKLSKAPDYDGQAKSVKVLGPWDEVSIQLAMDDWAMFEDDSVDYFA